MFFGSDDDGFKEALAAINRNCQLYGDIDLPEYEQYAPELYTNESADYQLVGEDPILRSKQLEALAQFEELAGEGLSDIDRAGFAKAREIGDQSARAGTQSAINDAQVRGVAGSGQEFALRELANQEGARRAQEAALTQQATAAGNRQAYLKAFADQGNTMRGQDYTANANNTNIINQFNQANTKQRNATNMANVDQRNQAFQYNQDLKDKTYNNQMGRADRIAGMNDKESQTRMAQNDQNSKQRQANINSYMNLAGMGMNAFSKQDEE